MSRCSSPWFHGGTFKWGPFYRMIAIIALIARTTAIRHASGVRAKCLCFHIFLCPDLINFNEQVCCGNGSTQRWCTTLNTARIPETRPETMNFNSTSARGEIDLLRRTVGRRPFCAGGGAVLSNQLRPGHLPPPGTGRRFTAHSRLGVPVGGHISIARASEGF